jgi:hypothetical protein
MTTTYSLPLIKSTCGHLQRGAIEMTTSYLPLQFCVYMKQRAEKSKFHTT